MTSSSKVVTWSYFMTCPTFPKNDILILGRNWVNNGIFWPTKMMLKCSGRTLMFCCKKKSSLGKKEIRSREDKGSQSISPGHKDADAAEKLRGSCKANILQMSSLKNWVNNATEKNPIKKITQFCGKQATPTFRTLQRNCSQAVIKHGFIVVTLGSS